MKRIVVTLIGVGLLAGLWPIETPARERGRHERHSRGETCWRTNRQTHAHFRIC